MSVVLIGLSIGMLLFLLAAGLTLVFGLLGVVNFAHGSLYMLGAYVAFQFVAWTGNFWLALVLAPLVVGVFGGVLERLTLRPLYGRDPAYQLLLTFGYILVVEEFIRLVWGVNFKAMNAPAALAGTTEIFGSTVTDYRLFIIAFGALLSVALFYVIERTGVFVAGTMLAAISGVVAGPLLPLKLGMSFTIIIDCFIVVVIGGLGNIRGAILGALLIGMTRAVGQQFAADWIFLLTYGLLIITLIFRPEGLFNVKGRQA